MHLLYLDESGNPDDPADRDFILAGISAFEKNTHFCQRKVTTSRPGTSRAARLWIFTASRFVAQGQASPCPAGSARA